jgi:hypothetical protein
MLTNNVRIRSFERPSAGVPKTILVGSAVGTAVPEVSKDFNAFTFRIKQSNSSTDIVSNTRIF